MPLGISKATGVEEVAGPLGITAEDVVAFGDMPNDMPMLVWAGLGVAMGNAHPEAVAAADEVTAPNTDDGRGAGARTLVALAPVSRHDRA